MTNLPASLSQPQITMLDGIVSSLRKLPNVAAVVLGGSHASGFAGRQSDIDIGIYYREASPFSIDKVRSLAERISIPDSQPTVTGLYGWGPWVNGGAWIHTAAGKVDFLYRNLDQVQGVIEEGQRGIWHHDYDQQPPYGFRSVVYSGETRIAVPLYDQEGTIAALKQAVAEYPPALRSRIVQDSLWQCEFSLMFCRGFALSADVYNAVGCMTRVANALVHALFALNNEYFVSDKYASRLIDSFPVRPRDFTGRLACILANLGAASEELSRSIDSLSDLWHETAALVSKDYRPLYRL